jgi:DNA-binding NtrC family response regulator
MSISGRHSAADRRAAGPHDLTRPVERAPDRVPPGTLDPALVRSTTFRRTLEEVARLARDKDVPILVEGESGTGKSTIARFIHDLSPRAGRPLEWVLLGAIDDALAGSALFGHIPGAYTDARSNRAGAFASAQGGSLFLDEIGKASLSVQAKLLHAIEYGSVRPLGSDRDLRVDVRVICASNLPLEMLADEGKFLPDLLARLETFRVELPPLRARRADIPVLIDTYVAANAARDVYPGALPSIAPPLLVALQNADWPNNLRQLNATVRRLLIEAEGAGEITFEHCRGPLEYLTTLRRDADGPSLVQIEAAMIEAKQNASEAARILKIDRTTLYRRRRRLREKP